jgi:hypothetical protein
MTRRTLRDLATLALAGAGPVALLTGLGVVATGAAGATNRLLVAVFLASGALTVLSIAVTVVASTGHLDDSVAEERPYPGRDLHG